MKGIILFECGPLSARITENQCELNQAHDVYVCRKCPGLDLTKQVTAEQLLEGVQPQASGKKEALNSRRVQAVISNCDVSMVFKGDDADIIRRFKEECGDNGLSIEENVATYIELVLDGRAVIK